MTTYYTGLLHTNLPFLSPAIPIYWCHVLTRRLKISTIDGQLSTDQLVEDRLRCHSFNHRSVLDRGSPERISAFLSSFAARVRPQVPQYSTTDVSPLPSLPQRESRNE